jgi:uncharacterized protein (TIGR03067 family)
MSVAAFPAQAKHGQKETLEGKWECILAFADGKIDTEAIGQYEEFGRDSFVKGNRFVMRWANDTTSEEYFVEYSLNSGASPKEIDIVLVKRTASSTGERRETRKLISKGIYLLKNDVLVYCHSDPARGHPLQRPKVFSTDSPNYFWVFKKCTYVNSKGTSHKGSAAQPAPGQQSTGKGRAGQAAVENARDVGATPTTQRYFTISGGGLAGKFHERPFGYDIVTPTPLTYGPRATTA